MKEKGFEHQFTSKKLFLFFLFKIFFYWDLGKVIYNKNIILIYDE